MFNRFVTCSKNTPSESRAGVAATRRSRPPSNTLTVADAPSPTPSTVTTNAGSMPLAHAAAAAWQA